MTLKSVLEVTEGHRNRHRSIRHLYDFLLMFRSNHGSISYRFRDKQRFQAKNAKFSYPRVFFAPSWRGFSWNWVSVIELKRPELRGYRTEKEVWRYLQPSGLQYTKVTDRRTDRQTPGRQQRPRVRIASRDKHVTAEPFESWLRTPSSVQSLFIFWQTQAVNTGRLVWRAFLQLWPTQGLQARVT